MNNPWSKASVSSADFTFTDPGEAVRRYREWMKEEDLKKVLRAHLTEDGKRALKKEARELDLAVAANSLSLVSEGSVHSTRA